MKKILILIIVTSSFSITNAQTTPAEQLANKIAQKMKDTLSLSDAQKQSIYQANLQLHNQKLQVRQQQIQIDSLTNRIQVIEKTRDTLYHSHLSAQQYQLYKQKKRNLISNN